MSFREKSAWVFLISIVLVAGFYFLHLPWTLNPEPSPRLVRGLLYCIVALIIIEVAAHIVLAVRSPREAVASKDERERLIDLKAIRVAHYVYLGGSLLAVATIHLRANAIAIGYGVLLAFVVGEAVKNVLRIVYHRRGF